MLISIQGSWISSISPAGGISAGLSTTFISPWRVSTWYSTLGAVVKRSRPYSLSSLSWTISI